MTVQFPGDFSAITTLTLSSVLLGDDGTNNGTVALSVLKAFFDTHYATAAQGAKADTALQSADIGVSVQAFSSILAGTEQSFTTALKNKLDGIAASATANSADAFLLARANHTGDQAISTIDGLQSALDGKQAVAAALTSLSSASANGVSLVTAANYAAMRELLSVYSTGEVDSAISAAIAALLDSAPGALDTLNELAAALGDDPNFATTITNALATKQPLDATLTDLADASVDGVALVQAADYAAMRALLDLEAGTDFLSPAAIAAAYQPLDATLTALAALTTAADKLIYATGSDTFTTTDLTSVARTLLAQTSQALMRTTGLGMSSDGSALVTAADYAAMRTLLGVAQLNAPINAQTGTTYTLAATDNGKEVTMDNGSANTLTIPANADVALPVGTTIIVTQLGAGTTTIQAASGVTLNGVSAGGGDIGARYQGVSLRKHATDVWTVQGNIGEVAA